MSVRPLGAMCRRDCRRGTANVWPKATGARSRRRVRSISSSTARARLRCGVSPSGSIATVESTPSSACCARSGATMSRRSRPGVRGMAAGDAVDTASPTCRRSMPYSEARCRVGCNRTPASSRSSNSSRSRKASSPRRSMLCCRTPARQRLSRAGTRIGARSGRKARRGRALPTSPKRQGPCRAPRSRRAAGDERPLSPRAGARNHPHVPAARRAPVAVFCHLALVALDLERLRGGLVRRQLFEPAKRRRPHEPSPDRRAMV